jgi:hypothetical protein
LPARKNEVEQAPTCVRTNCLVKMRLRELRRLIRLHPGDVFGLQIRRSETLGRRKGYRY